MCFPCYVVADLPVVWIQSQLWELRGTLSEDQLPLTLEQGPTASATTITEEETDQISGLDEDLQKYELTLIPFL